MSAIIINDPLYGFVQTRSELISELLAHPWMQRMRRIRQLGMGEMVYPGAVHTRFHHALGAMHLMQMALESLQHKDVALSADEVEAAQVAILLHDIGHGPFSHALEETLLPEVRHESLSFLMMKQLNKEFNGALSTAIRIFQNTHPKKFLHQLISSQLDIDRLDYLSRDSFFTGVKEGAIGTERIIAMMNVHQNQLVIEEKGIYNIENFLTSRRLMYWQVYLHKASVSAERLLVNIIRRSQYLIASGEKLPASNALQRLLGSAATLDDFNADAGLLDAYAHLDDEDVWGAIKLWQSHRDRVLSELCTMLLGRKLFAIRLTQEPIQKAAVEKVRNAIRKKLGYQGSEAASMFAYGAVSNEAYVSDRNTIQILMKNGQVLDVAQASDLPNIKAMGKIVKKNYLCWPKNLSL